MEEMGRRVVAGRLDVDVASRCAGWLGVALAPLLVGPVLAAWLLTAWPVASASAHLHAQSAPASSAQEAEVAGRWMFTIEAPEGAGTMQIPFVFEEEGGVVTGRPDLTALPQFQAAEIEDGRIADGVLSFSLRVGTEQQSVVIDVEATVDGDAMTGEARVAELEQASSFTARRIPPG